MGLERYIVERCDKCGKNLKEKIELFFWNRFKKSYRPNVWCEKCSKKECVKVTLEDERVVELKGGKETLEAVEHELSGGKNYVQEYETIEGEIITDLEILSIVK